MRSIISTGASDFVGFSSGNCFGWVSVPVVSLEVGIELMLEECTFGAVGTTGGVGAVGGAGGTGCMG